MNGDPADSVSRYFAERQNPGVISAYLFGSWAKARAHSESDVDVAVLLRHERYPERRERFDYRVRLASELPREVGTELVDVIVLNDAPPQFARTILQQGKRIFCSDSEADRAFARATLLRAADIDPFLRRTRKRKLEAFGA